MLKTILCDYGDANILASRTITITGAWNDEEERGLG